jgi:hypothetical protein
MAIFDGFSVTDHAASNAVVIISPPSAAKTKTVQSDVPCVEVIIRRISKDILYSKLIANTNPVFIAFHKNPKLHILQIKIQTLTLILNPHLTLMTYLVP